MTKSKLRLHPSDQKEMLLRYLAEGFTKAQIARSLQVSRTTISAWMQKLDLAELYDEMHCRNIESRRKELTNLISSGLTKQKIAESLGVGRTTIDQWCKRLDLDPLYLATQKTANNPPCIQCRGASNREKVETKQRFTKRYYRCVQCQNLFIVTEFNCDQK